MLINLSMHVFIWLFTEKFSSFSDHWFFENWSHDLSFNSDQENVVSESVAWKCSLKSLILKKSLIWLENTCAATPESLVNKVPDFYIEKEIPAQVFLWEFCRIFKNTFFTKHHWTNVSAIRKIRNHSTFAIRTYRRFGYIYVHSGSFI